MQSENIKPSSVHRRGQPIEDSDDVRMAFRPIPGLVEVDLDSWFRAHFKWRVEIQASRYLKSTLIPSNKQTKKKMWITICVHSDWDINFHLASHPFQATKVNFTPLRISDQIIKSTRSAEPEQMCYAVRTKIVSEHWQMRNFMRYLLDILTKRSWWICGTWCLMHCSCFFLYRFTDRNVGNLLKSVA